MRRIVQRLIDAAPDAIIIVNSKGIIVAANAQAERLFCYSRAELVGAELNVLIPQRHRTAHSNHIGDYFRAPTTRPMGTPLELYARRKGGTEFPVEISLSPVETSDGLVAVSAIRDISDRIEAEEAIRRSEEKYRKLIELAPDAVLLADPETGALLDCNEAACDLFGRTREALIGSHQRELHPAWMQEEAEEAFEQFTEELFSGEQASRDALPIRLADGTTGYADIVGKVTEINGEEVVFAFFRDVTERKQKGEQLRQSESRLREAQRIAHLGHWNWDIQTGGLEWSDEVFRIFGYEPGAIDVTYDTFLEKVHPEDRHKVQEAVARALEDRKSYYVEHRVVRADGEVRVVEERGEVITNRSGELVRMVGTVLDITERKKIERELDRERELLQKMFDAIPVMITMYDPNLEQFHVNAEFERVLGWTAEEAQEINLMEACYPDPEYRAEVSRFMQAPGSGWKDFEATNREGEPVYSSWSNIRLSDNTQVGIGIDLTDRKHLEAQLRQSQKMETVGTLAGGIAHDFNNILHAVLVYVQMTREALSSERREHTYLQRATDGIKRAKNLTHKLLAFSRREGPEVVERIDLAPLVQEMIDLLRPTLSPEVELRCELQSGCYVEGDPDQIQQIGMNLLTNAHQAMGEHANGVLEVGVHPVNVDDEVASRHLHLRAGQYVRLLVSDTGTGMDAETQERIFEPFFTTKEEEKGSGLGLSVVHGIVRSYDGAITVYSEPGEGTTFHVYLPLHQSEESPRPEESPAKAEGRHILFVDDDAEIVEIESIRLQRLGYDVTTCSNGDEALAALEGQPLDFDLVITDYAMPGMTGLELAQEVGGRKPGLPIILISGFSAQVSRRADRGVRARVE